MNKRLIFIILSVLIITLCYLNIAAFSIELPISKHKAILIANNEVNQYGLNVNALKVEATKYNTPWNKYLPKDNKAYDNDRNKLKDREYWAVYYHNPIYKKGGDLCIFIDANSGNVISKIRWK